MANASGVVVNHIVCGPRASFPGGSIAAAAVDNVWTVTDRQGKVSQARGVQTTSDGDISVHLVDDPADVYVAFTLTAGRTSMVFDKVETDSSTTVNLSNVTILF